MSIEFSARGQLREEETDIARTEFLLREAAESGEHIELTDEEWSKIEQEALEDATGRSKSRVMPE